MYFTLNQKIYFHNSNQFYLMLINRYAQLTPNIFLRLLVTPFGHSPLIFFSATLVISVEIFLYIHLG